MTTDRCLAPHDGILYAILHEGEDPAHPPPTCPYCGAAVSYDPGCLFAVLPEQGKLVVQRGDGEPPAPSDAPKGNGVLPPCPWSAAVALDPKHRPQQPQAPATTVRMEWRRYPQEAHLLDIERWRYRRLTPSEIAVLQGFPADWGANVGLTNRKRIAGLGNAVPPPLAEVLTGELATHVEGGIVTCVEICAGFGGLALGARRALRVRHLALVDFWKAAVDVLRGAGPWNSSCVFHADVKEFDWSVLGEPVDLLCGGPPCQPWSHGGHSRGADDERDLLGEMPELVARLAPKAFLFENVPGLTSPTNRPYAEWLVSSLRDAGGAGKYGVAIGVLDAADYGVPQNRRRVFIVGLRGAPIARLHRFFDCVYARRTHASPSRVIPAGKKPWITIAEAIPDWGRDTAPWRRWVEVDGLRTAATKTGSNASHSMPAVPERRDRTQTARLRKIELVWPTKGLRPIRTGD